VCILAGRGSTHRWAADKIGSLTVDFQFGGFAYSANAQRKGVASPCVKTRFWIEASLDELATHRQDRCGTDGCQAFRRANLRPNQLGAQNSDRRVLFFSRNPLV
jgi:hypothetical protein